MFPGSLSSPPVFEERARLGSYSLTLMKQPNNAASYVMIVGEEMDRGGVYVSLSEGFCSSVV